MKILIAEDNKDAPEDALIETARRPLYTRTHANDWAKTGSQQYGSNRQHRASRKLG